MPGPYRTRRRDDTRGKARAPLRGWARAAVAALLLAGCTWEAYAPPDPPTKPLHESELHIDTVELGTPHTGRLDCAAGRCRIRYRFVVPAKGVLHVRVDGPIAEGTGRSRPRLARIVLQGMSDQSLALQYASDVEAPPLQLSSAVKPGIHYVLVQALGGEVEFVVRADFVADAPPTPAPDAAGGVLAGPTDVLPEPSLAERPVVPGPGASWHDRPGEIKDGADFAYDPRREREILALRDYAFAQDVAAMMRAQSTSQIGNPLVLRQVQREVRYALDGMGMREVPIAEAQFMVSVHTTSRGHKQWYAANPGIDDRPYDNYFQTWGTYGLMVRAHTYEEGTLVINFIDRASGELLWHGWTTEPIPIAEGRDDLIKTAVRKVLAQF